jgi:ribonuclease Z
MKTTLKIISIPTEQSTASVAITCDDATYVFNTGEGCQRIIQQNKFKISKLKTILFSRIGWDCLGGLPGMILTATDSLKINELSLVGPVNLINFVAANYPFLNR